MTTVHGVKFVTCMNNSFCGIYMKWKANLKNKKKKGFQNRRGIYKRNYYTWAYEVVKICYVQSG